VGGYVLLFVKQNVHAMVKSQALVARNWVVCFFPEPENFYDTKQKYFLYEKSVNIIQLASSLEKKTYYCFRNFYLRNDHLTVSGWVCFVVCETKCPKIL
jgi:hypothetical protein